MKWELSIELTEVCQLCRWYTMVKADGSVEKSYRHFYQHGIRGFKDTWPYPSLRACKLVGAFVGFEAFLQILLPGERFLGPSTPAGNRPFYTVCSSIFSVFYLSVVTETRESICAICLVIGLISVTTFTPNIREYVIPIPLIASSVSG